MRKPGAYTVYLILSGANALFFAMITTVNLVYQITVAGLNPLQLILVGTTLEAVAFLCEVPTGVVADVYSRRLSVIIGFALTGAGFLLEGLVPTFAAILLSQVLWGIGYTFISGAREAWIADEIGEAAAGGAFLRGAQVGQFGGLLGIGISVALASVRLNLPIVLGGALFIGLAGFLLLVMPETGFAPTPREERNSWGAMSQTFVAGLRLVRGRPVLLTILGIGVFHGLWSEGFDRLSQYHLLNTIGLPGLGRLDPVVWFGLLSAAATLLGIGATEIARRRLDTTSHLAITRVLFCFDAAIVAGVVTFGLSRNFALAAGASLVVSVLRRTAIPIGTAWVNQSLDPKVRATVLSMNGQVDAFGQIAGGPLVGAVGNLFSVRAALVTTGLILSPVLLLYARVAGQGAGRGVEDEEGEVVVAGSRGEGGP